LTLHGGLRRCRALAHEKGGSLLDLEATVNLQAAKLSLRATLRLGSPDDPLELEVAG
jgi:hypothetical protein